MKTQRILVLAAAAALPALLVTAATFADAPGTPPAADLATIDGGLTDGPQEDGADAAPVPLKSHSAEPYPEDRSAEPKAKEWDTAPLVAIDRSASTVQENEGQSGASCEARRLREWIRIRCKTTIGAILLQGGEREGFAMHLDPVKPDDFVNVPEGGDVVFPVRRGDRREIEWLTVSFGYRGSQSLELFLMISEQWVEGDPQPWIVVRG